MTEYSQGGYLPGPPIPVLIDLHECIMDRHWRCQRRDEPHRRAQHSPSADDQD